MDFTTNCMGFPLSTPIIAGSPGVTGSVKRVKALVDAGTIVGSYGWGGKTVETLAGMIPNLKVDVSDPVLCKGVPAENDFESLDRLAGDIAEKHKENDFR